ncbi:hypothetical protein KUA55_10630 [Enterococcus sp. ALS3]|uniref:WxL domain-containing protein n=1 Tax=Enterococcus alishanensis TaxID=1303817 RepID=A0ABS6TE25_9ENTE|nr:hypothetical protein [Enterococcus alishanensis]MBV7391137.1 hypothetical protein [Enterococcus alishanensis]
MLWRKILVIIFVMNFFLSSAPVLAATTQDSTTSTSSEVFPSESSETVNQADSLPTQSTDPIEQASQSDDYSTMADPQIYTVIFETDTAHLFSNQSFQASIKLNQGDLLTDSQIPIFEESVQDDFEGWKIGDKLYSNEQLKQMEIDQNIQVVAQFKEKAQMTRQSLAVNQSIKDIIASANQSKVIVVPSPTGDGNPYHEYDANENGVKQGLFDLYTNGHNNDFVMYFGSNVTLGAATMAKAVPTAVSAANVTFTALTGKVNQLTITGVSNDPISNDTTSPTGAKTLSLPADSFFGNNIILRNIRYSGSRYYMNGYNLNLNGGSYGTSTSSIFGGTDNGDVTGNPIITVNSTGSGYWDFYGGNDSGGTLNGSTTLNFNNSSGNLRNLAGGAKVGTINGNTAVTINNLGGEITDSYYGGGVGNTASATANVTGNVVTNMDVQDQNTKFKLNSNVIYGGVQYGNINGTITTTIAGYGAIDGSNTGGLTTYPGFIGGSREGNIGSDRQKVAITNNIDFSKYSAGVTPFSGGNNVKGTITGSIKNTVRAGQRDKGALAGVYGGGSRNITTLSAAKLGTSNAVINSANDNFDSLTKEQRKAKAESAADFKVYGNIDLNILGGCVSLDTDPSYTRAAGYGGYIEGDTSVTLGTLTADKSVGGDGLVYSNYTAAYNLNNLSYDKTKNTRSYFTGYDVVGGGGTPGDSWSIYIYGHTKVTMNNVVARWTYGGNFSGVVDAPTNSSNYASEYVMNAGIADTTEGTGYIAQRTYGSSHTQINYGQVDWFTSGGGWGDWKQYGDASVEFVSGIHNGTVGGTYGYSGVANHVIDGNVSVSILGGDFSGSPSHTSDKAFSAGPSNQGTITGDATLTLDLRTVNGKTFVPPPKVEITAGRHASAINNYIKLGKTGSKVNLNIYANKDSGDVLKGATIFGDGGNTASDSQMSDVNINIDAPDSTIGTLYATQYSNVASDALLRNVNVKIQRIKSISGISGGNQTDNITNLVASNSAAKNIHSNFQIGQQVSDTSEFQTTPILISGVGLINFTSLDIDNKTTLTATTGNIKNGANATVASHSTTYNNFGDITLHDGSGLGILTNTAFISAGKLSINGENSLESPEGKGKVNISDINFSDPTDARLTWIKNSTTNTMTTQTGSWFGKQSSYQVLTINPTGKNAEKISPLNFKGIEKTTGKTFIGDNDITNSQEGYGLMLPGAVYDYQVNTPIAEGKGFIEHNVAQVTADNKPILQVWGSEVANTPVTKGRLVVPAVNKILPTLTFSPDKSSFSWLYSGEVVSTKVGSSSQIFTEQKNSDPVTWTSADGEYSYSINIKYSNKAEVTAKNAIITEKQAAAIQTKEDVVKLMTASGRPNLQSNLDDQLLALIKQPLAQDQLSRVHDIRFSTGTSTVNQATQDVQLTVVKDDSSIAPDGSFAIVAQDIQLKLVDANNLANLEALNQLTKASVIFADGRSSQVPSLPQATFDEVKGASDAKTVIANYTFSNSGQSATKDVNISILGTLSLNEVPSKVDFGAQKVSNTVKTYTPTVTGALKVKDTRGVDKQPWRLTLRESDKLADGSNDLSGLFNYTNSQGTVQITDQNIPVEERSAQSNDVIDITQQWDASYGLHLTVPVEKQLIGDYQGTLTWSLENVPGNNP